MNFQTVVLIAVIAVLFVIALRYCVKNKGCGGDCGGCMYSDTCRKKNR